MIRAVFLNLFLLSLLFSQNTSDLKLGIKIGLNFSNISGAKRNYSGNLSDPHIKLGSNFGIILNKAIDNTNSFQFEMLYNDVGSEWGRPFFNLGYDGDYAIYELKYFSFFGYFKLKSKIGNLIKDFDFIIGAAYSYNFSAKQKWIVEVYDYDFETGPKDIRSEINHHEIGYIYGLKIPFKNRRLYLSLLFYNSISSLYSDSHTVYKDDFYNKEAMHNHTISLCFDYFIF